MQIPWLCAQKFNFGRARNPAHKGRLYFWFCFIYCPSPSPTYIGNTVKGLLQAYLDLAAQWCQQYSLDSVLFCAAFCFRFILNLTSPFRTSFLGFICCRNSKCTKKHSSFPTELHKITSGLLYTLPFPDMVPKKWDKWTGPIVDLVIQLGDQLTSQLGYQFGLI